MDLKPKDHGEAVAIFRSQIIGILLCRPLTHGELAAELRMLSRERFRPPDAKTCDELYTRSRQEALYGRKSAKGFPPRDAAVVFIQDNQHALDDLRFLDVDHRNLNVIPGVRPLLREVDRRGRTGVRIKVEVDARPNRDGKGCIQVDP